MWDVGCGWWLWLWVVVQVVVVVVVVMVVGGGDGADVVLMICLCRYTIAGMHQIQVAEHLGVNSRRPRHLGVNVQEDGGRKMPHFCGEIPHLRSFRPCRLSTATMKHLWNLLHTHNRDIDHHKYSN